MLLKIVFPKLYNDTSEMLSHLIYQFHLKAALRHAKYNNDMDHFLKINAILENVDKYTAV